MEIKIKNNVAVSDSGFVFNPATGDSYSLNPIGVTIFKMLQKGSDFKQVKTFVLNEYQVEEGDFEKDFYDFSTMIQDFKLSQE